MTVRDIRLKWPEAERRLTAEGEIVVTRHSKPIARILPYELADTKPRKRFNPGQQAEWLRRFWKEGSPEPSTDELLERDRAE